MQKAPCILQGRRQHPNQAMSVQDGTHPGHRWSGETPKKREARRAACSHRSPGGVEENELRGGAAGEAFSRKKKKKKIFLEKSLKIDKN